MRTALLKRSVVVAGVLALALGATACSSTRDTGEQFDDAAISSRVKARLAADPDVNPFEIDVDTQEGEVRLSGFVDEANQKTEAEQIARETEGVRSVRNDIQVGGKSVGAMVDDAVIVTKIKAKLVGDPEVRAFNIDVDSQKGVVTLTGRVENMEAKRQAEELARQTDGVQEVRNLLKVGDEQQ